MDEKGKGCARGHSLDVHIDEAEREWLTLAGARELPRLDAGGMLRRLLERAMEEGDAAAGQRAYQLEIYRASGYAEHHPDYPNPPASPPGTDAER
jgi:hypothetical protein